MHAYQFNLSNKTLQLDDKIHALVSLGIVIPKNSIKLITIETDRKHGHVLIEDNPCIPDSIYRINESQILVPISNETGNELRLSENDIKFKFITSIPELVERVSYIYITSNELSVSFTIWLTERFYFRTTIEITCD